MDDSLTNFGVIEPTQIYDQEFENRLKECKTEEERDKLVNEYVSTRLITIIAVFAILFIVAAIVGVVIYIFKLFSR